METILSLFIFKDAYVVSFLVAGIMITVLLLLMFNFKSPESVIMNEVNSSENVEGALRRVLSEKSWVGAQGAADSVDSAEAVKRVNALENEVLSKDREIADLHKQLTQGNPLAGAAAGGDNSDLMSKIDELEARLREYEIIEDDIADLSLYKAENEKLKSELDNLKGSGAAPLAPVVEESAPQEEVVEAAAEEEDISDVLSAVANEEAAETEESAPQSEWTEAEVSEESGRDLVAEFEKVVNNKDAIVQNEESTSKKKTVTDKDPGKVQMMGAENSGKVQVMHPKLKDVKPDSKEEAEVFIADLKSLKKGS